MPRIALADTEASLGERLRSGPGHPGTCDELAEDQLTGAWPQLLQQAEMRALRQQLAKPA